MAANGGILAQVRREKVILALISAKSVKDASRKSDVPARTIERWLTQPDFREAYSQAKQQVVDHAVDHLKSNSLQFAEVISKLSTDDTIAPAVRLNAACNGLTLIFRIQQHAAIEERLRLLEVEIGRILEARQREYIP